ncbi:MAG: hypothetical protein IIC31_11590 [Chloroflexi bacterium]|nr:hypothetical protein [Chloroflexota bacterium]
MSWWSGRLGSGYYFPGANAGIDVKVGDDAELERRIGIIARTLQTTPFPSGEAIVNTHAIAVAEEPASAGVDPHKLWDRRWVERLEGSGFIAGLVAELSAVG